MTDQSDTGSVGIFSRRTNQRESRAMLFGWISVTLVVILPHFTGPPVPRTARVHSTPQLLRWFYVSSVLRGRCCACAFHASSSAKFSGWC
eukprot:1396191-Pyramimonas_sp.AAC.1